MKYLKKEDLPYVLREIVKHIEVDQKSNFIKAYKYPNNSWKIVFDNIFINNLEFEFIEKYLTNKFDLYDNGDSYYDDLYVKNNNQVIYLKEGSIF